ncbi:MAG: DUF4390 domain-containing protein [Proteobacteria bacterium]|nr:MAG: DUF4390 domain-containing protein [Pseudomonadota bacterium]
MKQITAVIYVLCCLALTVAHAQSIALKNIAVQQQGSHWQVTPHYNIELSEAIIEAIHNGIEITFVSEVRLIAEKNWWPDKTLRINEKRFEIHYFSLSSQYQLKQLGASKPTSYMTLDSLLEQLAEKTEFDLEIDSNASAVEGRFYLDHRALPSTMQLPILLDPQWSLRAQPSRQALPNPDKP